MPLSSFYVTGGTVRPNAPCYVERQADRDLFEALQNGEFCYILTARQMGKSSLMVRMARRLRDQGAFVAVLDLTASGRNVTPEQWYNGLLRRLGQQLKIEPELDRFWSETEELGPLQRWIEALRRVVLPALRERSASARLFVFIDEIDVVRSLPFSTDEFFAAIRELYNRRALEPDLAMVSFCLLGVAAPQDLIADTRITPFNIGRRIELRDFTPEEAAPLAQGLVHEEKAEEPGAQKQAAAVLKRIIYWTGGHPYLTQRLCAAMAERKKPSRSGEVDSLCRELFLTRKALDSDDNLVYVRERILNSPAGKDALLDLYQSVLRGRKIEDSQTNPLAGELRLAGITRPVNGALAVRNRIYETVFSPEWTRSNMSSAETERQRQAYRRGLRRGRARAFSFAAAAALLLLGILAVEENLRGRFLLGRWMKEQRTAGEKFGSVELAGPALVYHDVEAMYGAAKNLTNLFEKTCPDEKPKTTLPDGRSLCWDHLGLEVELRKETLERLHEAIVAKPVLASTPLPPKFDTPTIRFVTLRSAAIGIAAAAMSHVHEGQLEAALRDFSDLAALTRPPGEFMTLVDLMIRVAVRGLANSALESTLSSPLWTDEALRELGSRYQEPFSPKLFENTMRLERAWGDEMLQDIQKSGYARFRAWVDLNDQFGMFGNKTGPVNLVSLPYTYPLVAFVSLSQIRLWNLRQWQETMEGTQVIPERGTHVPVPVWRNTGQRESVPPLSVRVSPLAFYFTPPNYSRAREAFLRHEILRDLLLSAIAVRRYQLAHQRLPERLAELVPEFLPEVPIDRFSGEPIQYRRIAAPPGFHVEPGAESRIQPGMLLYSVWTNGEDDGANKDAATGEELDLALRIEPQLLDGQLDTNQVPSIIFDPELPFIAAIEGLAQSNGIEFSIGPELRTNAAAAMLTNAIGRVKVPARSSVAQALRGLLSFRGFELAIQPDSKTFLLKYAEGASAPDDAALEAVRFEPETPLTNALLHFGRLARLNGVLDPKLRTMTANVPELGGYKTPYEVFNALLEGHNLWLILDPQTGMGQVTTVE